MNQHTYTSVQTHPNQEKESNISMENAKDIFHKHRENTKRNTYDQVNVRLPAGLNDWLNHIVRESKRMHGFKFPKEVIIETALGWMMSMDIEWTGVRTQEDLVNALTAAKSKKIS